jgi:hypothetical protein
LSDRASEIVIHTLDGAPGLGKTYSILQRLTKLKDKILIMSFSHAWIDEWEGRLIKWGIKVRHWYGWELKCPLYNDEENRHPLIEKLKEYEIPTKNICTICHEKKLYSQKPCPYHKQFINLPKVVIAPIQYAWTKYVKKFSPKYIIVDDCLRSSSRLHTIKELNQLLQNIQHSSHMKEYEKQTLDELFKMEKDEFENFMEKLKDHYQLNMKAAAKWVEMDERTKWMPYLTFDPEEIEDYYRCRKFLGKLEVIDIPALFPLFDYIAENNAEMTVIEARFNDRCMELWKKRYRKETKTTIIFVPKNIDCKIEDKGSIIYKVGKGWFPPGSLEKNPNQIQKIRNHIGWRVSTFHEDKTVVDIGLVRPKRFEVWQFITDELWCEKENLKTLHFGNLRGQNLLENCSLGFVVCTYVTEHRDLDKNHEGLIENFKRMFVMEPSTVEYVDDKSHGGYYHFKDEYLDAWRWLHEEYEMYQAIHRFRPLNQKCVVYVYANVPKEIEEDGLIVKKLSFKIGGEKMDEKTKWLIEYVKAHNNCVPVKTAKYDLRKEFNIGDEWARVMINKIVGDIDELEFDNRNDLKCIIYKL